MQEKNDANPMDLLFQKKTPSINGSTQATPAFADSHENISASQKCRDGRNDAIGLVEIFQHQT